MREKRVTRFRRIIAMIITIAVAILLTACQKGNNDLKRKEDFSFSLTWGCYGISSYDSQTGKLVKTTDATNPEDYVTTYILSDEELEQIYDLIADLNVNNYPDVYDSNEGVKSKPSMDLVLTVCIDGKEKTISANNIAYDYESQSVKGQKFLTTCQAIQDILTATEEWKALPDYEFYYE